MVTRKGCDAGPLMRRELSPAKRHHYDVLADSIAELWSSDKPPKAPSSYSLAYPAVYESSPRTSFICIHGPSDILKNELRGGVLIDLGAGRHESYLTMAHLMASLGAREYIAVDAYTISLKAEDRMSGYVRDECPDADIVLRAVRDDMLRFLAYLPTGSAHVCMNAIDQSQLITLDPIAQDMYAIELAEQIARVVPLEGVAFGLNSPFLGRLPDYGFEQVLEVRSQCADGIYQKKVFIDQPGT